MGLTIVTPPSTFPVTLAEMKAHCSVEHNDDDDLLLSILAAATGRLDGRDGMLGKALVTQTWRLVLDAFPAGAIDLPLPPCQSVDAVAYLDAAGDEQELAPEVIRVFGLASEERARILPAVGAAWPDTAELPGAVAVTFSAGYGDAGSDVPAPIREAILTAAAARYRDREGASSPVDPAALAYREFAF